LRIYIDESGNFVVPGTPSSSFCLVLALVIPSTIEAELFYEFLRLRDTWPTQAIEIKGSSLNEFQAAQVINLLSKFDVMVEFRCIDTSAHTHDGIEDFKTRQAAALLEHLTPDHDPDIVRKFERMAEGVRGMSNQLFLQAFVTIHLVLRIIHVATLYFVQRSPKELAEFFWTVDRKNRTLTKMEKIWSTLVLPMGEAHFARSPLLRLEGADYSYFDQRYKIGAEGGKNSHLEWIQKTYAIPEDRKMNAISGKAILSDQLEFKDSLDLLGLQLSDMLANTLRRALNRRLEIDGWQNFGQLLVQKATDDGSAFMHIGLDPVPTHLREHAAFVAHILERKNKPMDADNR
jgi:hypothetical protein